MEFLTLLTRGVHLVSICVWLGGTFYQRMIFPSAKNKSGERSNLIVRSFNRLFLRMSHISLVLVFVSGLILALADRRFSLIPLQDRWSVFLLFKLLIFMMIMVFSYGYSRMLRYLGTPSSNGGYDERAYIYIKRIDQYQTLVILLGVIALVFGTAMHIYG